MKVGDLVYHFYTGRCFLVAGLGLYRHSVTLVGFPSNQVFNTVIDLELLSEVKKVLNKTESCASNIVKTTKGSL